MRTPRHNANAPRHSANAPRHSANDVSGLPVGSDADADADADELDLDDVIDVADQVADDLASTTASWLRDQPWVATLTRVGWAAKAVVYGVIGWMAIVLAAGRPTDTDAEYTGIVSLLADRWWSRLVLAVVAVGLALYVAFRILSILLIDTVDLDGWAHRVAFGASAGTYVAIGWSSLEAAVTGFHLDEVSTVERVSASLLSSGPGRLLVGASAIGALGLAAYFVYKGATRRFLRQLDLDGVDGARRRALEWSGAVGWLGRGAVIAVVAVFLIGAAVQADPRDARGLDRALQEVAFSSLAGAIVTVFVGVLLILYAFFCALSAPNRSLAWSREHDPEPNGRPGSEDP